MTKNIQQYLLCIILVCFLCQVVLIQPSIGIRVGNILVEGTVDPDSTFTHTMMVSVGKDEVPTDILVEAMGLGQKLDSTYYIVKPADDLTPYSARTFITLDKTSVHLEPNASAEITATFRIPQNVGQGGRYAVIYMHTLPVGSGSTGYATAVMVPVLLTITGPGVSKTGSITDVQVSEVKPGQPLAILTTLKNTGNHHYKETINEVSVKNSDGLEVTNITKIMNGSVYPTFSVIYKMEITKSLPVGTYTVDSLIRLKEGTILDKKTTTFEVKQEYVPPFSEVTITVSPGNSAVLATSDGRIGINFPAGAVLDTTKVTLKPVLPNELPGAPANAKHAVTSFSVEGFTGLLSKDAALTVKYSAEDLAAAGGNANKLMLARWDKAENKWTLVPTTVNQGTGTLTVTTNRFSIWVVMVSEGAVPEVTKTAGFTIGIAGSALAAMFIIVGLRRKR